jgi:ATP-dependent protease ClpP protease subunit
MTKNNNIQELFPILTNTEQSSRIKTQVHQYHTHTIFIDDAITEPSNYRDEVQTILTCGEQDGVNLLISSEGGSLETTLMLIQAIQN